MKIGSFRVRLALLSAAVSGVVLLVFAGSAWVLVHGRAIRQLDRELAGRLVPQLRVPRPPEHWRGFATNVDSGDPLRRESMIVMVKGYDLFERSPNWPEGLSTARLAGTSPHGPGLSRREQPPRPPDRRGPPEQWPPDRRGPPEQWPPDRPPPPLMVTPTTAETVPAGGRRWRLCTAGNRDVTVVIGTDLAPLEAEVSRVGLALLLALPPALLLIGLGSWLLAARALGPVEELAALAERVTASSLDQRLGLAETDDEFRRLVSVFNQMLARLQRSFEQATRFSADAAHELKTPLSVLQMRIEQALHAAPAESEQQRLCTDLLDEVSRLRAIVRKLLLLSLADAGRLEPALEPVNLAELAEALAEDAAALADGIAVRTEIDPSVPVRGDADLLRQALANLAANAVKYNRPDGSVIIRLTAVGPWAELSVSNTGPGIPAADQDRVFERFYRADPARSRRVDGQGLGMSLAREIFRAHGGDLVLAGSGDDLTTFTGRLRLS